MSYTPREVSENFSEIEYSQEFEPESPRADVVLDNSQVADVVVKCTGRTILNYIKAHRLNQVRAPRGYEWNGKTYDHKKITKPSIVTQIKAKVGTIYPGNSNKVAIT